MSKFLFVYRRGIDTPNKMSPEEMQKHMQRWQDWLAAGLEKGWLVERGEALAQEGRVINAKKIVTDGPFVESKEIVGGFSIVQAGTIDAAAEIAKGCPALQTGGSVEVRPFFDWTAKR